MYNIKIRIMKTIKKTILLLAAFSLLYGLQAQDERKLDYFDAISATGDIEVTLIPGDEAKAVIYAEGISEDDISVFTKGKTLKIQLIEGLFKDFEQARVEVTYQQIRAIKANAGAKVYASTPLKGDQLNLRAASGAHMKVIVDVNALEAEAFEGAVIDIEGSTENQEATAATGGQYLALSLQCERTFVKANTGGKAEVVANKRLDANANTGGSIGYTGDPAEKNTRSLISGGIRRM